VSRANWTLVLAVLFLALLGWYLLYSEQIVRAFRADVAVMTRMYAEVQTGLTDPDPQGPLRSLARLQDIILESGVPLVLSGPGDTIIDAVNLPFEADLHTVDGQSEVLAYVRRLDARHPPVGDPRISLIHFGDPPELQRLRWIPWFQVTGLLLTFLIGIIVIRAQRRAAADRAWTAMARELAHQLGTPISSLQGWLEVLRLPPRERPGPVADREIAEEISEDIERLERVSRRFELIGRKTELGPLELAQVIRAVERYLKIRLPRAGRGIRLRVQVRSGLPPVRGSDVLLTWALENLVKNALDAMAGRGGTITIRAFHREPGWVTVQVRDTGPGVAPEVRDRLFEAGTTTKSGGWGVGLSLARRIVERIHGGRIELLRSDSRGTVFQLRLPAAGEQGDGSRPKES
jgi:signal transduction histidine kinase